MPFVPMGASQVLVQPEPSAQISQGAKQNILHFHKQRDTHMSAEGYTLPTSGYDNTNSLYFHVFAHLRFSFLMHSTL